MSAWTSEAEDPVLRNACGPRRLLDVGSWPGAVVRLGLVSHLRGQLELYSYGDFVGRLAERFTRDPLSQARMRPVRPGQDRSVAVLPGAVPGELFQPVAWRDEQVG